MSTNRSNGGSQARLTIIMAVLLLLASQLMQGQTYTVFGIQCPAGGAYPDGRLIADSAGNLYGVTGSAGAFGWGTVYEMASDGTFTVLYSFTDGADGGFPFGGVIRDRAGNLYGTTGWGGGGSCPGFDGGGGCGTVFKLAPDGTFTVLHTFAGGSDGGARVQGW